MQDFPKIIHYCWFGGAPLDDMALRCIESWKKFFPGYEIIQWNEDNFDITACDFMKKAYMDQKWAFVSDVARLMVVYKYGGIYFDTDVEVIASYDDILSSNAEGFIGIEKTMMVNTGLGFGAVRHSWLVKELLSIYERIDYDEYRDNLSQVACTVLTTRYLQEKGYLCENKKQRICGFDIYPISCFSPIDYYTGKLEIKTETHSIHWYNASWLNDKEREYLSRSQKLSVIIGKKAADQVLGMLSCANNEGVVSYTWKRVKKYLLKK